MEVSQSIKATSSPLPSPDRLHIASLTANRLILRSSTSLSAFRSIILPPALSGKNVTLKWCRPTAAQPWSYRLLLFSPEIIKVWDLRDAKWTATINNGSGGMGKVVSAEFGFDMDEVLAWSDFGSKLTVWNLATGKSVDIRDPKFSTTKGCAFRSGQEGGAKVCALLSRPGAQDIITLHASRSWKLLRTITLPTHDAQGVKWSPDGRWLAVWDAASVGIRVHIYTADGYLYRTYSGEHGTDDDLQLGVKSVEWSSCGQYLAVGGFNRKAVMLSNRTFTPQMFLEHTTSVQIEEGQVWQENVSANSKREYIAIAQPVTPTLLPASQTTDLTKMGLSILASNSDGTLLATRDDAAPAAVWVWDITTLKPRTVLLQHSPVKRLSWHPSRPDLLLIQCTHEEPVTYLWAALSDSPMVISAPLQRSTGKLDVSWMPAKQDRKPAVLLSDTGSFMVVWPDGRDPIEEEQEERACDEDEEVDQSLDSVVEMLAGRTPLPATMDETAFENTIGDLDDGYTTGSFEDTFRGKRPLGVA